MSNGLQQMKTYANQMLLPSTEVGNIFMPASFRILDALAEASSANLCLPAFQYSRLCTWYSTAVCLWAPFLSMGFISQLQYTDISICSISDKTEKSWSVTEMLQACSRGTERYWISLLECLRAESRWAQMCLHMFELCKRINCSQRLFFILISRFWCHCLEHAQKFDLTSGPIEGILPRHLCCCVQYHFPTRSIFF